MWRASGDNYARARLSAANVYSERDESGSDYLSSSDINRGGSPQRRLVIAN